MMRRILSALVALAIAVASPAGAVVSTNPRVAGPAGAGMQLLAASAVAASVTGSTSETALATITIPAGAMGTNGGLLIFTSWSGTASANNKTPRVRLGGLSGTLFMGPTLTTSPVLIDMRRIKNRNSASSQVGSTAAGTPTGGLGSTTAALPTGAIDTSVAVDLVISGQLATSSETLTLEAYEVWLLP